MRHHAIAPALLLLFSLYVTGCESPTGKTPDVNPTASSSKGGGEIIEITPEMTLPEFVAEARGPKIMEKAETVEMKPISGVIMKPADIPLCTELDTSPVIRFQAFPAYPAVLYRGSVEGDVLLAFMVNTNGTVSNIMIVEASDERFAFAALQAVKKWRFRSGKKSGRDSACMVAVPIAFRLASR